MGGGDGGSGNDDDDSGLNWYPPNELAEADEDNKEV